MNENPRHHDVLAFVLGSLLACLAAGMLWVGFGGSLGARTVGLVTPLILVLLGVGGLVLSRGRTR